MADYPTDEVGDCCYTFIEGRAYIRDAVQDTVWRLLSQPSPHADHRTILGVVRATEGPFTWRYKGQAWQLEHVEFKSTDSASAASSLTATEGPNLYLVLENQAEGEPDHWYLFVAHEGQRGNVYQVTGDAEHMHYDFANNFALFQSTTFKNAYLLASSLSQAHCSDIERFAAAEPVPQAVSRAEVTENCQGWACRVLAKMTAARIITRDRVAQAESMMQPI